METTSNGCRKDLVGGFLASILKELGFAQDAGDEADPVGILHIVFGAELMNQGVLLEGLRMWSRVPK